MIRTTVRHFARLVALIVVLAPVRANVVAQSFVARDNGGSIVLPALAVPAIPGYRITVGERATYDVELKGHGVGTGSLEVLGREEVNGFQTLHAALKVSGGLLFARVNDQIDSWFDPIRFFSRRFQQDQRELRHTRVRKYEISPEKGTVHETMGNTIDSLGTSEPLDDVSMLFYVRTLPLRVGDVDTIPRYFKAGHDVIVRVVRTETITVPAGTFKTIVVQPTITNAGGLFGQGGKAEVYFTNDSARTLVMLRSSVPVLGSLSLTLREIGAAK
ncbi:MAG: hypothetical protein JWM95_5597 [Gemmatimonadetes bacterium]|nr:hypothetical protein [Gemmatimonadota bacterium]